MSSVHAEHAILEQVYFPLPDDSLPVSGKAPVSVVAIASDLHIELDAKDEGGVNPFFASSAEITQALLEDVRRQGVDVLILSGDITNSSRPLQHQKLRSMLYEAAAEGLTIYVINGNHDIGQVTVSQFSEVYADFGYNDAVSRDPFSLSYSIRLDDQLLLMVDTGGYLDRDLSGRISPETLLWIEQQILSAKASGLPVLVIGHHPLLTAQAGEFAGKEELTRLLLTYKIPLYVCGHMHGRNVSVKDTLTELVVEQTISYPCSYALLSRYEDGSLLYQPHNVDLASWSSRQNAAYPLFLQYEQYRDELYLERCRNLVETLKGDRNFTAKKTADAVDFYQQFSLHLSDGTLYWEADRLKQHDGYSVFMKIAEESIYSRWVKSELDTALPFMTGFYIRNNQVFYTIPPQTEP